MVSANAKNLYTSYNLFIFAQGLINVFINLFFFSNGGYLPVIYFQITSSIFIAICFTLSGYLLERRNPEYVYILGLALFILMLIAMPFASNSALNVIIFGVLYGSAVGALYAGFNIIFYEVSKKRERVSMIAVNNLIGGLVTLIAPSIAGFLIQYSSLPGNLKFLLDFMVAAAFMAVSALLILKVKYYRRYKLSFSIGKTIIKENKAYTKFRIYHLFDQVFLVTFNIILPIYVFVATSSYVVTGLFVSYMILVEIVANLIIRKGFQPGRRFVQIAITVIVLSSFTMFLTNVLIPPINAFIFGGVYNFLATILDTLVFAKFMGFMDRDNYTKRLMFWINREYYLNGGRVIGLVIMLLVLGLVASGAVNFIYLLPILSLYSVIYLSITKKDKKK